MKIQKCTSLLLALLVLFSNAGLAFNVHYCGGEIAGISSVYHVSDSATDYQPETARGAAEQGETKSCCAPKASDSDGCCDNKIIKSEKKSDVIVKTFSFQIDAPFVIQQWNPVVFVPVSQTTIDQTADYYCDAHAPPLYQLYSQYLFYA